MVTKKNKMLQTNSIFNYFNSTNLILKIHNIYLFIITAKNTNFFIPVLNNKNFDTVNLHSNNYQIKKKLNKNLSLNFFYSYFNIQWCHIGFKGKSYRIRAFNKSNKFTFNFGYSHWTKLKLEKHWKIFRKRRQRFYILGYFKKSFQLFKFFFRYIRIINRYTLRGLRLAKQPIKRRFGKISQHISSLH